MKLKNSINEPKEWLNFDDLINSDNLYALCISFFNLVDDNDDFFILNSYYKKSKFSNLELDLKILVENNELISKISNLPFILEKNKHCCYIKKNGNINFNTFFSLLYKKIQRLREKYDDKTFSQIVCASLFFPRGSIDINANFFAVDIYRKYQNEEYLNKIFYLLTSVGDIKQLNFNFREFQQQHIKKINTRNTQIRINLKWLCDYLSLTLKQFNKYKFNIINNNLQIINSKTIRNKISLDFYDRIQFYITNILKSKSTNLDIDSLRKEIGFDSNSKEFVRNSSIVNLAKIALPDFCSGCIGKYELKDRTFKYKNSDKWYLEINHVISFANNNVDQIDNLCKLCPACHKALTPNRANESLQKEIIKSILNNNPIVSDYVNLFIESNTIERKIEYVFEKLR